MYTNYTTNVRNYISSENLVTDSVSFGSYVRLVTTTLKPMRGKPTTIFKGVLK